VRGSQRLSHQDPGFLDHVMNKKAEVVRVYLPPDANTLLCMTDRRRETACAAVLDMDQAIGHCSEGIGIWGWASNDRGGDPDVVMACAGDVPTLETLAAFHGYPWLVHRLAYRRAGHTNLHVRGYREEGTTTTRFDMVVPNDLDRFHVVGDVIDRVPSLRACGAYVKRWLRDKLLDHEHYIREHGDDMPEIRDWKWDVADGGAH